MSEDSMTGGDDATVTGQSDAAANLPMVIQAGTTGRKQIRSPLGRAFSRDKQDIFFARLAETCNISASAKHAGVSHNCVLQWRRKDSEFSRRYDLVLADAYADLEMRLLAMVRDGVTGEQWEEIGEDGVKRLRFRRDAPGQLQRLLEKHRAAQDPAPDQEEPERAPRETLDELIDRLTERLGDIEAEEAGEHGEAR